MKLAMTVLPMPNWAWVSCLRSGHWVWLVKEQEYAQLALRWQKPDPGHRSGNLFIKRFRDSPEGYYFLGIQDWFVGEDGRGLDGNPLIQPVSENLPKQPEPRDKDEFEDLQDEVKDLRRAVLKMEIRQRTMDNLLRRLGVI